MNSINQHQLVQFQKILDDHIEQMSKNLENVSNGQEKFTFKICDRSVLTSICEKSRQLFRDEPIIINIPGECIVVGDIHGHIIDLYRIFTTFDLPPKTKYLFLGDIVDRGGFSLETITLILVLKILFPNHIYIIRGNHEFDFRLFNDKIECPNNSFYSELLESYQISDSSRRQNYHQTIQKRLGNTLNSTTNQPPIQAAETQISLQMRNKNSISKSSTPNLLQSTKELNTNPIHRQSSSPLYTLSSSLQFMRDLSSEHRKESTNFEHADRTQSYHHRHAYNLFNEFSETFSFMPFAAIFGESILCIHGGIGGSFVDLNNDLNHIERPIRDFENNTVENILWSDPLSDTNCDFDNLNFIASPRGRGCLFSKNAFDIFMHTNHLKLMIRGHQCVDGIQIQYNSHLITVFSASNYCGLHSNKAGVVKILNDRSIHAHTFPPFRFLERSSAVFLNHSNQRSFHTSIVYPKRNISTSYSVDLSRQEMKLLPLNELNQGLTIYITPESNEKQTAQTAQIQKVISFEDFSNEEQTKHTSSKTSERRRIVIVQPKLQGTSLFRI